MDVAGRAERAFFSLGFAVLLALPAATLTPGPARPFGYSRTLLAIACVGAPLAAGFVAIDASTRRLFRGIAVLVAGATPLGVLVLVGLPVVGFGGPVAHLGALATVWAFTYAFGWRNGWAHVAPHLPVVTGERVRA
ncbi:hypothetical protein [Halarchaeum sp. P4]|uniref:hypothetical protein n=1 Tax=Halarchaeum sp. P4 TaxID=3421639 RepID=UPI003EBE4A7D